MHAHDAAVIQVLLAIGQRTPHASKYTLLAHFWQVFAARSVLSGVRRSETVPSGSGGAYRASRRHLRLKRLVKNRTCPDVQKV